MRCVFLLPQTIHGLIKGKKPEYFPIVKYAELLALIMDMDYGWISKRFDFEVGLP